MFTKDSRTENFLKSMGVHFQYKNGIRLPGDFVKGWNTDNIGRPVAVRDEAVYEYAALMGEGSPAPAPILHKTAAGYRVCDGVQRLSAGELHGSATISAYVVDTDDDNALASLRVLANPIMQGHAEAPEWSKRRAIEVLVIARGLTFAAVAKKSGWPVADIKRIAEAIELQERITNLGGPEFPDSMLALLQPYLKADFVLTRAKDPVIGFLNTLKKAKVAVADAEPFLTQFFAAVPKTKTNTRAVYIERLDAIHADPEMVVRLTGRQRSEISKDVSMLKSLKAAENTLDQILMQGGTVLHPDEYFQILNRIADKLQRNTKKKKK